MELLRLSHPKRKVRVYEGDFNLRIHELIKLRTIRPNQAAFCLLDQRTFECQWSTVEALANYKKKHNKIELFYFLPIKWLGRAIAAMKDPNVTMIPWWGRADWEQLVGKPPLEQAKLFCCRFEQLGYKSVMPWPIHSKPRNGSIMYYMIHATDHDEAPKLMRRAYVHAVRPPKPEEIQFDMFPGWENPHIEMKE